MKSKRGFSLILDIDYIRKNKGSNYNKLTSIGMVRKTKEDLNTGEVVEERRYYINSIYCTFVNDVKQNF